MAFSQMLEPGIPIDDKIARTKNKDINEILYNKLYVLVLIVIFKVRINSQQWENVPTVFLFWELVARRVA